MKRPYQKIVQFSEAEVTANFDIPPTSIHTQRFTVNVYAGPAFRKMSILIKFVRLDVRMPIQYLFVWSVVHSFVLQNGFTKWRTVKQTKETIKYDKKKWTHNEIQDLIKLLQEKPFVGYFFEQVHKEGGERKLMQNWRNILIPLQLL